MKLLLSLGLLVVGSCLSGCTLWTKNNVQWDFAFTQGLQIKRTITETDKSESMGIEIDDDVKAKALEAIGGSDASDSD